MENLNSFISANFKSIKMDISEPTHPETESSHKSTEEIVKEKRSSQKKSIDARELELIQKLKTEIQEYSAQLQEAEKKKYKNQMKKELKKLFLDKNGYTFADVGISDIEEEDSNSEDEPFDSTHMSALYYNNKHLTGFCPYCKGNRISKYVWSIPQIKPEDYEHLFARELTTDGTNMYWQDPYNACCIYRNLRTDITKFKRDRKHKRDIRNWEKFLAGERAIYEEPKVQSDTPKKKILKGVIESLNKDLNSEKFLSIVNSNVEEHHNNFELAKPLEITEIKFKAKNGEIGLNFLLKPYWRIFNRKTQSPSLSDYSGTIWYGGIQEHFSKLPSITQNFDFKFNSKSGFVNLTYKGEYESESKNEDLNEKEKASLFKKKNNSEAGGTKLSPKMKNIVKTNRLLRFIDNDGNLEGFNIFEKKKRNLEICLEAPTISKEKLDLYNLYTKTIHNKEKSTWHDLKRFLCFTVMMYKTISKDGSEDRGHSKEYQENKFEDVEKIPIGRHHLCFYLDGTLIAILVQDYLPSGQISVYFMYNPVFSPLNLGKVSILIETEMLRKRQLNFPEHKYYYLMCYIANCKPLQYKITYKPCEIFCPETKRWLLLDDDIKRRLKANETRLAPDDMEKNFEDEFEEDFLGYLGQNASMNNFVQQMSRKTIGKSYKFDIKELGYKLLQIDFARSQPYILNWWMKNIISRYAIIRSLGLNITNSTFFDTSDFILDVADDDDPELKKEKKDGDEAAAKKNQEEVDKSKQKESPSCSANSEIEIKDVKSEGQEAKEPEVNVIQAQENEQIDVSDGEGKSFKVESPEENQQNKELKTKTDEKSNNADSKDEASESQEIDTEERSIDNEEPEQESEENTESLEDDGILITDEDIQEIRHYENEQEQKKKVEVP